MQVHKKTDLSEARRAQVVGGAFIKATQRLELNAGEITNIIGISPSTWSRFQKQRRVMNMHSKEMEAMLLFIRIYRSIDALLGGNDTYSAAWLRTYNEHLAGVPVELIQKTEGLVRVVMYLDAMRGVA